MERFNISVELNNTSGGFLSSDLRVRTRSPSSLRKPQDMQVSTSRAASASDLFHSIAPSEHCGQRRLEQTKLPSRFQASRSSRRADLGVSWNKTPNVMRRGKS